LLVFDTVFRLLISRLFTGSSSSDDAAAVGGVRVKGKKRLLKEQRKREAREMREVIDFAKSFEILDWF
jgi:hypothetical protein